VTHEVVIKIFNTESIGYLIDSFLKYPDLTINGFEWLPLEVIPLGCRKSTLRNLPSRREFNRVTDTVLKWAFPLEGSLTLSKSTKRNRRPLLRRMDNRNPNRNLRPLPTNSK
jgi:hypothetical protein